MIEVAYTVVNGKWEIVTRRKAFASQAAYERWLDKDDNGVVEILGTREG